MNKPVKKPLLTQKRLLFYALQGAFLGVMATLAVFLYTQKPETFHQLQRFRLDVGLGLFLIVGFAWACNGGRIYTLSRSLGYPLSYIQSLSISLSSEFGIAATPGGVGGAVIRLALLKRAGVNIAHGTSMLTIDIALDGCYFLILLPFAIMSLMGNDSISQFFQKHISDNWKWILLGLFILIFIILILRMAKIFKRLAHWLSTNEKLTHYRIHVRARWLRWKLVKGWHQFKEGWHHLLMLRKQAVCLSFLLCALQWTCRYSVLPITLYALSIPNNPIPLFLLQGLLFTFSLLIVLPGGGGGVEVTMALILGQIYPVALVGVVVLLWRFFTYHLYLLVGGCVFFGTCSHLHSIFPKAADEDESLALNGD